MKKNVIHVHVQIGEQVPPKLLPDPWSVATDFVNKYIVPKTTFKELTFYNNTRRKCFSKLLLKIKTTGQNSKTEIQSRKSSSINYLVRAHRKKLHTVN